MIPERFKELAVASAILLTIGAGVLFDLGVSDVAAEGVPEPEAPRFVERALFCPPGDGADPATHISVLPESGERLPVSVPPEPADPAVVPGGNVLFARPQPGRGADVVGYGGEVVASLTTAAEDPVAGAGAAACTHISSDSWFFPAGSSELGADERILLYNPFPDEAVVALNFYTPTGPRSRTGLSDIAVPARSFESVSVNDFIQVKSFLGVGVVAKRGRVVAWRELFDKRDDRPHGIQLSLGGPEAAEQWYLPDGAVGEGVEEAISVLNPSTEEEAVVDVTLTTEEGLIQVPALMERPVPPGSSVTLSLAKAAGARLGDNFTSVSAVVSSRNGVEILAEKTVWYSTSVATGVASELGTTAVATRWFAPPATWSPTTDTIAIMNPTATEASVDISLMTESGDPRAPRELQGIEVPSGGRIRVPIGAFTQGRPVGALLEATGGIVVERFSYSARARDAATVMGSPLRR